MQPMNMKNMETNVNDFSYFNNYSNVYRFYLDPLYTLYRYSLQMALYVKPKHADVVIFNRNKQLLQRCFIRNKPENQGYGPDEHAQEFQNSKPESRLSQQYSQTNKALSNSPSAQNFSLCRVVACRSCNHLGKTHTYKLRTTL